MTRRCDDHAQQDHDPPTAENPTAENLEFSAVGERPERAGARHGMGTSANFAGRTRDDALVESWLAGLAPATARAYRGDLTCLAGFIAALGLELAAAGRVEIGAWVAWLRARGYAAPTVRRRLVAAAGFYDWLVAVGECAANPTGGVARPRGGAAARLGPDRAELTRLLEVARQRSARDELLVRLLCVVGLRVAEAVGLDTADVSHHEGRLLLEVTRKSGRHELVGVPSTTAALLHTVAADQGPGPLLRSTRGGRLSVRGAHWIVRRLGEAAGIPGLHPHALRHGYVTQALCAGVPLPTVAAGAGHRDVRVTLVYAEALVRSKADAAGAVEARLEG